MGKKLLALYLHQPALQSSCGLWEAAAEAHTVFAASIAILYYYIALSRVEAAMAIECVAEKNDPFSSNWKNQANYYLLYLLQFSY